MPKRDFAYMQGQRDAIARAALQVMLDKGVYGTSLRDICEQARVSIGALYVHFRTKEEVVVAAFALDNVERRYKDLPLPRTREEYFRQVREGMIEARHDPIERRRARLSLQFVADMALADENPPGLSEIYVLHTAWLRAALKNLIELNEAELPLGLERTIDAHTHAATGAHYMLMGNKDLDESETIDTVVAVLELTIVKPAS